jgi:hypothetical protein
MKNSGVLCLYVLYELSKSGRFEEIVVDMYNSLNFNNSTAWLKFLS